MLKRGTWVYYGKWLVQVINMNRSTLFVDVTHNFLKTYRVHREYLITEDEAVALAVTNRLIPGFVLSAMV